MQPSVLRNDGLLVVTAAIWGLAFVAQRVGMDFVGPFTFNGVRFLLGGILLIPLALRAWRRRGTSPAGTVKPGTDQDLKAHPDSRHDVAGRTAAGTAPAAVSGLALWGIIAGVVLFVAAGLQQIGLVYTTAGNAGFITGLYVVIVPLLGVFSRQTVGLIRWIAVGVAIVGLYLLAVPDHMNINPGDIYVLGCAAFFAIHVQLVGYVAQRLPAIPFSVVQYLVVGVLSVLAAGIFEEPSTEGIRQALVPILYGGIGSISIAYTLQVVAQRHAPATHAAIILSLEGTFAAIGGGLFLAERLSTRALLGCALMLTAMIMSQVQRFQRSPADKALNVAEEKPIN